MNHREKETIEQMSIDNLSLCLFPSEYYWIYPTDDLEGAFVGITQYLEEELEEIVCLSLPQEGREYRRNECIMIAESNKSATDLYSPLSGTVQYLNEKILQKISEYNHSYALSKDFSTQKDWLFFMKISDREELKDFMSYDEYYAIYMNTP